MRKGKKSATLSRRSRRKDSALGPRLVASLNEALAHARGEIDLSSYVVAVPKHVDVAEVRQVTALHAWEQGRRRPDRAARVLLAVIAKEPEAVLRALVS